MSTPGDRPVRGLALVPRGVLTARHRPRRARAARRGVVALAVAALLLPLTGTAASAAPTPSPSTSASANGPASTSSGTTTDGTTPGTTTGTSAALADTAARADALRAELDALAVRLETATEDHAQAVAELQRVVAEQVDAERALDEARATAESDRLQASSRVRSLAQQGRISLTIEAIGVAAGPAEGALDPADLLAGYRAVAKVAESDAATARRAQESSETAADRAAELLALRDQQLALEQTSQAVLADAQHAVDVQQALLDAADAQVRDLAAQQSRELDAAGLASAAADWAPGSAAGLSGPVATAGEPASAQALAAISVASTALGLPYQWGATGPTTYDCSGLVQWAFREAGVSVPRTTRAQYAALPHVPVDQARAGDLLYFASGADPSTIHHVGIYLGGGRMLHAPRTGDVVKVSAVRASTVYGVARPSAGEAP